jgi:hypothetical protein
MESENTAAALAGDDILVLAHFGVNHQAVNQLLRLQMVREKNNLGTTYFQRQNQTLVSLVIELWQPNQAPQSAPVDRARHTTIAEQFSTKHSPHFLLNTIGLERYRKSKYPAKENPPSEGHVQKRLSSGMVSSPGMPSCRLMRLLPLPSLKTG